MYLINLFVFCCVAFAISCPNIYASDVNTQSKDINYLKRNFNKLYSEDYQLFSSILESAEKNALSCTSPKSTSTFLQLADIDSQNAEFNEYFGEVIEKLLVNNPTCFFDGMLLLGKSSQLRIIIELKQATFVEIEQINGVFEKFKSEKKYKRLSELYFQTKLPLVANTATSTSPTCIAQFCFDKLALRESDLIRMYGRGIYKSEGEKSFHCYLAPNQKLYLRVTTHNDTTPFIDSILVSDKPVCSRAKQPIQPFKKLITLEGLSIGDSYDKAIQLYGVPQYVRVGKELNTLVRDEFSASYQTKDFDNAVAYGSNSADDLLVTWLFIRNGKIAAILMSISE